MSQADLVTGRWLCPDCRSTEFKAYDTYIACLHCGYKRDVPADLNDEIKRRLEADMEASYWIARCDDLAEGMKRIMEITSDQVPSAETIVDIAFDEAQSAFKRYEKARSNPTQLVPVPNKGGHVLGDRG